MLFRFTGNSCSWGEIRLTFNTKSHLKIGRNTVNCDRDRLAIAVYYLKDAEANMERTAFVGAVRVLDYYNIYGST